MVKDVVVKNPTSMQHVVPVKYGQSIKLYLNKESYINPQVIATGYLRILEMLEDSQHIEYTIILKAEYVWSFYSSCFLGEVWIQCNDNQNSSLSKLCVILQCSTNEKRQVLTTVNPEFYDIRMKPYNILEVIVYDPNFSDMDNWTYIWEKKVDLALMELGDDEFRILNYPLNLKQPEGDCGELFSKLRRCDEPTLRAKQHHFWFRLSKQIIDLMGERRIMHVGDLVITGHSWNDFNHWQKGTPDLTREYRAAIHVDLSRKYMNEYLETAKVRRRTGSYQLIPLERGRHSRKQILPSIKNVTITEKTVSDLQEGCRVAPAVPSPMAAQTEYEADDYFDYFSQPQYQNYNHYRYPPRP